MGDINLTVKINEETVSHIIASINAGQVDKADNLTKGLVEAIGLIRHWHGETGWPTYWRRAPEMQRLRNLIGLDADDDIPSVTRPH